MQLTFEHTFDAPIDTVFAILTSAELYAALDDQAQVTIHQQDQVCTVRIERAFPTHDIPSPARSLVGDAIQILEVTQWVSADKGFSATFDVRAPGKPLTFIGTIELAPNKTKTTFTLSGNVKVNVKVIGAGLEKKVGELLTFQLQETASQAQELLR